MGNKVSTVPSIPIPPKKLNPPPTPTAVVVLPKSTLPPPKIEKPFDYDGIRERITKWCNKLYQDGSYNYKKYQECIKSLETGISKNYKRDSEDDADNEKNMNEIYGYYQDVKENDSDANPAIPTVKDDFQLFNIYHGKEKIYLVSEKDGRADISTDFGYQDARDWQLINLGSKTDSDIYAIRSKYGKFLIGMDNNKIAASSNNISTWAQWKVIKKNDMFMFYSIFHKKYMAINGDDLLLIEGINDENMWELKEKVNLDGRFVNKVNRSDLYTKKNNLTNSMLSYYQNALDNKFEREYYENKITKLNYLRDSQKDFLLTLANSKIQELSLKKDDLTEENHNMEERLELFKDKTPQDLEELNKRYTSECGMTEDCINSTVELQQPTQGFIQNFSRIMRINIMRNNCNWTPQTVNSIINRNFLATPPEVCTELKREINDLTIMLNGGSNELEEKIATNIRTIELIDKEIESLESFKNDVISMYDEIKSNDIQELRSLVEKNESERLANLVKFRQFEKDTDAFITEMTQKNKSSDGIIAGLSDEIERKLSINNKLGLSVKTAQSKAEIKNYKDIVNNNTKLINKQLNGEYMQFYVSAVILLCIMLFIAFMTFKTYNKFMKP